MRIDRLTIHNFRCFEYQEFSFSPRFNVFAGANGTGKTATLEAIASAAGQLLLPFGLSPAQTRPLSFRDARVVSYLFGDELRVETQYPVEVTCMGSVDGVACAWKRELREGQKHSSGAVRTEIIEIGRSLTRQVMAGESVTLPLLAYYGTGRLWAQNDSSRGQTGTVPVESRLSGYENALYRSTNDKKLFEWIKTQKLISLEENRPAQAFEGVKHAVASCLRSHGWDELDYRVREDALVVIKHDDAGREIARLPFDYLSDGYRNAIAMVADIARRTAVLNPQFGVEAASKTPGIVLIDEIDLHLHPMWQRSIVQDLRRAFPEIQFFATSHSPFIIQSLRPGELLDLNPDGNMPYPDAEYSDQGIEDIAIHVMDTPGPSSKPQEERAEVARKYYRLLEEGRDAKDADVQRIKRRLDELSAPYSDNIAYFTFLEMKREAAGLGRDE